MRSADGLALLREIAQKHGPVEIACNEGDAQRWTVKLADGPSLFFAHGESLEYTVGVLYDRLGRATGE